MKRYGMVIGLKPENEVAYRRVHAAVPQDVLRTIRECNIENFSIFLRNSQLFAYFEYVGTDFSADMAKMGADPATQKWWETTEPMQVPFPDRATGAWWSLMDEVFHVD
jgi:L-rhamnose mutarotase